VFAATCGIAPELIAQAHAALDGPPDFE